MRRADRLFQLVQLVRGRRLTTAEWLAGRLEISLRTVYRDVADLQQRDLEALGQPLGGGEPAPTHQLHQLEQTVGTSHAAMVGPGQAAPGRPKPTDPPLGDASAVSKGVNIRQVIACRPTMLPSVSLMCAQ